MPFATAVKSAFLSAKYLLKSIESNQCVYIQNSLTFTVAPTGIQDGHISQSTLINTKNGYKLVSFLTLSYGSTQLTHLARFHDTAGNHTESMFIRFD